MLLTVVTIAAICGMVRSSGVYNTVQGNPPVMTVTCAPYFATSVSHDQVVATTVLVEPVDDRPIEGTATQNPTTQADVRTTREPEATETADRSDNNAVHAGLSDQDERPGNFRQYLAPSPLSSNEDDTQTVCGSDYVAIKSRSEL